MSLGGQNPIMATRPKITWEGEIKVVVVKEIIFLGRKEIMTMGTSPIRVKISKELWKGYLGGDEPLSGLLWWNGWWFDSLFPKSNEKIGKLWDVPLN